MSRDKKRLFEKFAAKSFPCIGFVFGFPANYVLLCKLKNAAE
jgi:hypothetical protein